MYRLVRPLLFLLPAERTHELVLGGARLVQQARLLPAPRERGENALEQRLWGLRFPNPLGLAAGMDKNARLPLFFEALGFGFVEVGSVSARPAPGNPPPRLFRLPQDRALINRMGLNNDGATAVAARLLYTVQRKRTPLGVNLAKTHDPSILGDAAVADFCESFARLAGLADYVALNISCPNTREGKTFADPQALDTLLAALFARRREVAPQVPVLLKLAPADAPDPGQRLDELVAVARTHGVAGFIACNTAPDRHGLTTEESTVARMGPGGLSGRPLRERSTALVRSLYRRTAGALPIIGVGGVDSAESAYEKIRAGAALVQLYTGLVYEGPGLVRRIRRGLLRLLERDGLTSICEAVGRADESPERGL